MKPILIDLFKTTARPFIGPKVGNIYDTNFDFPIISETVCLAGVSFEDRQLLIPNLEIGSPITLTRDPKNKHDRYAIKVFDKNNNHIGWIPKDVAFHLSQEIDAGVIWKGKIEKITGNEETLRGVVVKLYHINK